MKKRRFVVMGMGPIGCILGAHLAKAGLDVTAVDILQPRIEAIQRDGIRISGVMNLTASIPKALCSLDLLKKGEAHTLFVCTKATFIERAIQDIEKIFSPGTEIISFQNGLDTEESFARHFGRENVFRVVINFAGNLSSHTSVKANFFNPPNHMGCLEEKTIPAAKELAGLLTQSGLETAYSEEIKKHVWQKVILNALLAPISAITGLTMKEAWDFPPTLRLIQELAKESIAIAKNLGYDYGEDFYHWCLEWLSKTGYHKPSMRVDMEAGVETEIDFINGAIARHGDVLNLPIGYNLSMTNLIKGMHHKAHGGSIPKK